ncbi:AfsR/SARP family transcriptional regulator [Hamadaea tsunoensis]|uniref:AfsR/SARP family transcriptional regulator n=1 Tax=Hamadaea tsunoensis TaxID=53368 RepID=UPI0004018D1B|nr:BTAD domain-containing putative transcriptional regulator [Hamadaea tsunoensis]
MKPIEFRLLGPMEVRRGGCPVDLGPRRGRAILGMLLLHAGRPVHLDRLITLAWYGDVAPRTARNGVQVSVSRLRAVLGDVAPIGTVGEGYRIDVDPATVDLYAFRELVGLGRRRTGLERLSTLRTAERLWRGPLLAGTFGDDLRSQVYAGVEEERLAAVESRLEAQLHVGLQTEMIGELTELAHAYPARERLAELLIRTLHRLGRREDALDAYHELRRRLAESQGLDPSPALRELHLGMLNDDPALYPPGAGSAPGVRLLPWDVPDFAGRTAQLAWLDTTTGGEGAATVVISAISGLGGVGKTALAVHWAHRRSGRFPDGQIYLDLRGYDRRRPVEPLEALVRVLRALGIPADRIPSDVDAAADLYRSTLAELRILVLLDNAGSVDQIRPLLPGGRRNVVVVTSRDRLGGLLSRDGARRLDLGVLAADESRQLLAAVLGADRARREAPALRALADALGHLPLALRIAGATLVDHPEYAVTDYLAGITAAGRVDSLVVDGDGDNSVRAVFDSSRRLLSPVAARLFRLLGLVPGPSVTLPAAAATAGLSEPECRRLLDDLVHAHLVVEQEQDRYGMHDLVKEYAGSLTADEPAADGQDPAEQATGRLMAWYIAGADRADLALRPYRVMPFAAADASGQDALTEAGALAWFDAEGPNLLAAVTATETTHPGACWRLAAFLAEWLERRRDRSTWREVCVIGVRAARADADLLGEAAMRQSLAVCLARLGEFGEAVAMFSEIVNVRRRIGDPKPLGLSLVHLGTAQTQNGEDADGIAHIRCGIDILGEIPDARPTLALALNNLGWAHYIAGRTGDAVECFEQAAVIARETGNHQTLSFAEGNLGQIHSEAGDPVRWLHHWSAALEAAQNSGDQRLAANSYAWVGKAHLALGDRDLARSNMEQARRLYVLMDDADAEEMTQLLAELAADPVMPSTVKAD